MRGLLVLAATLIPVTPSLAPARDAVPAAQEAAMTGWSGPGSVRGGDRAGPGGGYLAAAARRLAKWAFLRAAAFLWIAPFAAFLSNCL